VKIARPEKLPEVRRPDIAVDGPHQFVARELRLARNIGDQVPILMNEAIGLEAPRLVKSVKEVCKE
jgi:hypothetical protein